MLVITLYDLHTLMPSYAIVAGSIIRRRKHLVIVLMNGEHENARQNASPTMKIPHYKRLALLNSGVGEINRSIITVARISPGPL